jgi:hypothetical protein
MNVPYKTIYGDLTMTPLVYIYISLCLQLSINQDFTVKSIGFRCVLKPITWTSKGSITTHIRHSVNEHSYIHAKYIVVPVG